MSNDELNKLAEVVKKIVKEENAPIIKKLDATTQKLDQTNEKLDATIQRLDKTNEKLDGTVQRLDKTNEKLNATIQRLDKTNEKLDATFDQVGDLTEKVDGEIIPALEQFKKYFKQIIERFEKDGQKMEINQDNIERLDKRLKEPEARLGIQPPPELQIIK